ncbi:glutamate-5-semialdehyde dehydrogenase [Companilactobacillus sp.]|jgi:glutamate-5-semialdehyde dehydrogenase|uniref:glutamate-5-semialdehyde dehydrogenase n=1 Tax=Companilactobacillus sp. TaxID=2767905 RepID=UPI0025C04A76|nr:glutamate-5-semialdehyde dehydrogenase [Companilactobacillus sp.]MCH4009883.1 glutamate-5-semialdehyde dehydrogenase [Companilactobacillus sp.]MCH4052441.1 glutamate-5-semialdehyde dehydrogenase [Companilactobacillus sp.]MCH4077825.1 glutamate-5-semialdehyde dehydrogenase [Companilactobacillus sp.]MCH4126401.1 glutamate-5-semialdehyde dehydrogenase [Companilactobacillus sp.]MCI1312723.1 glutamate-5-semialdehyde dehydrogenase [Companilactobacillus sp.]
MTDLNQMGKAAQKAEFGLGQLGTLQKNKALVKMADDLEKNSAAILAANAKDLANAKANDMTQAMQDRLLLDDDRIKGMADGLREIADLEDPIGKIDRGWTTEDGLDIVQERVPLGVIGIIFEARPNVTVDAAGLCFKSGNAAFLRGGKEAINSNIALSDTLRASLRESGLDENAVQLVHDTSHEVAQEMMELSEYLDVLIPRGSGRFIKMVVNKAKVPIIETGAGNCHIYVDEFADLDKALKIIINAKVQRPSVCNAAEKVIVHQSVAATFLPTLVKELRKHNVEIRGDQETQDLIDNVIPATEEDWSTEYNDYIIAIKVVSDLDSAIKHINKYNTQHSEAIITDNYQNSRQFQKQIDAAVVYVNASTRFTDGNKFGFGAEIGISTQKLHARGPMGANELTTTKYLVNGNGQIRE